MKVRFGIVAGNKRFILSLLLVLGALLISTTACSAQVQAQSLGLRYNVGSLEGDKFDKVVEPGSGGNSVVNDKIYQLPLDQRTYNACSGGAEQGCDAPEITVATKDQIVVDFALASAFKLNTRTDDITNYPGGTARKFLEEVCRKTNCINPDNPADTRGWDLLLKERYRPALEAAFKDIARQFTGDDLVYNNPVPVLGETGTAKPALEQVAQQVGPLFLKYLEGLVGGKYFCGPSFDRKIPSKGCPPIQLLVRAADFNDSEVKRARQQVKIAKDRAAAAKLEADGAVAARKAFGSARAYTDYLMAQAALECAKRADKCTLVISSGVPISVSPR